MVFCSPNSCCSALKCSDECFRTSVILLFLRPIDTCNVFCSVISEIIQLQLFELDGANSELLYNHVHTCNSFSFNNMRCVYSTIWLGELSQLKLLFVIIVCRRQILACFVDKWQEHESNIDSMFFGCHTVINRLIAKLNADTIIIYFCGKFSEQNNFLSIATSLSYSLWSDHIVFCSKCNDESPRDWLLMNLIFFCVLHSIHLQLCSCLLKHSSATQFLNVHIPTRDLYQ